MSMPGPARTLVLLRRIHDQYGPQGFGRVCQTLLALTFKSVGFKVTKNPVGVPDILSRRANGVGGCALEVKTSEEKRIVLPERELRGLTDSGLTPALAVLSFPDIDPRWYIVDIVGLVPGAYDVTHLARRPLVDVGFDLNGVFRVVLGERMGLVTENLEELELLLRDS
jgi:hypothetical protein